MTPSLIETVARAIIDAEMPMRLASHAISMEDAIDLARAALQAMKTHASENFDHIDLGDGWVICKGAPHPFGLPDEADKEAARSQMLAMAVKIVEASGYAIVPAGGAEEWTLPTEDHDGTNYWADAIGGTYRPVHYGKHTSWHPMTVKAELAKHKDEPVADVLVGLVFSLTINREREKFLLADANERIAALEALLSARPRVT